MKTTVIESKKKEKELTFPLLAKGLINEHNHVVLFTSQYTGVVVQEGDSGNYLVGEKSSDWRSCADSKVWRILESPVTIKFEF